MKYTSPKDLPLVVLFGRTNVGKSTLFNTLTEKHKALIADLEGTTRDANLGEVEWENRKFRLVDTGGIIDLKYLTGKKLKTDDIEAKVQAQARDYLSRADLILFLVDTRAGLLPTDKQMVLLLKKLLPNKEHIILVANKADSPRLRREISEFNKLALGEPMAVSATSGSGTGDLLDIIIKKLPKLILRKTDVEEIDSDTSENNDATPSDSSIDQINISIIGKPNVGKSSLVNAILGEERIIVSPIPHTTREPQDTDLVYRGQKIKLIDTAGISKKGQKSAKHKRVKNTLEKFSIKKSLRTLRHADIALLVIDINEEITKQEARLLEEIVNSGTSLILIANKWDLIKERNTKIFTAKIYSYLPFATWAPIQFISALTGEKVEKVLDLALAVAEARKIEISENALSKFLRRIVKKHAPTKAKGTKHPYIYTLKQANVNPPKFIIRIGAKDTISDAYVRFIENRLREKFDFLGTPIYIGIQKNPHVHGQGDLKHLGK